MKVAASGQRAAVLLLAVMLCAGCAGPNPGAGRRDGIARVFIDVRRSDSGIEFSQSLLRELTSAFGRYGIRCRAQEHDARSTDDPARAVEEFYPDMVITVVQTDTSGVAARAEFVLSVFRPNASAPVWSTGLTPESGAWDPASPRTVAGELLTRFENEGLIGVPAQSR
jgi:hypothetical protein